MHSLYAVADIGNGPEVLKLYVEEMNTPGSHETSKRAYQLQNVEKYRFTAESSQKTASFLSSGTDPYTVADLFELVKRMDRNFHPGEPSVVANEDGTPMEVYHATDADFNIFQREIWEKYGLECNK